MARCTKAETRATETNQDDQEPINIDEVVVSETWQDFFDRLLTQLDLQNSYMHDLPNPGIGGSGEGSTNGGGSGSSSSGNSGDGDGENNTSDHNSKIKYEDEETKELIEPLLDSISQDCMGKTLLDALDGVTIKTGTGRNGYDSETNTIELNHHNKYGYRDYVLLEELTLCYQRNRYGDMYVSKRLNAEIEAKVGWFLYRQRNPNALLDSTQSEWQQDAFYTPNGVKAMHQLAQHHLLETSIENPDYQNCYRNLAAALSVHRIDKNGVEHNAYATYSFSWDLQDWVFTCLQTLMENC